MKVRIILRLACLLALWTILFTCELLGGGGGDTILGGMDFVGRGYDVFSNYADPLEVKAEVLDFKAMNDASLIERIQLEKSEFQTIEGTSAEEYMSRLSEKASVGGSFSGFSGSVKVNFDKSTYVQSGHSFATVQTLIEKYSARIKLGTTAATLKNYLTDSARAAINDANVAPEEVFVSFGTHVLRGIIIGGRLDYNVSAEMSKVATSQSIGVFAEAGYEGAFSVNVSSATVSDTERDSFNTNRKKSLKVYGGSSEYGQYIIAEDQQGYAPWIESIKENPVFCEFDRATPMVPIWSLCDDAVRASALESGYAAYAIDRGINVSEPSHDCIVDIKLLDQGHSAYTGLNPTADGYDVIPQDLNYAVNGSNYIYILCKYGLDTDTNPAPITNLHTVDTSNGESALPGYIKPAGFCDLNKGGGGHYVYLYFSRGGSRAVRGIATETTRNSVTTSYYSQPGGTQDENLGGRSYQWDAQDLNAGCSGGAVIKLGWTYDFVN